MAKKLSFSDLDSKLTEISPLGSIVTKNAFSKIDEWIPTGNYMLNAQISGSIHGGIPNCRSTLIAGESGCLQADEKIRIYLMKSNILTSNKREVLYERSSRPTKTMFKAEVNREFKVSELSEWDKYNSMDLGTMPTPVINAVWTKHVNNESVTVKAKEFIEMYKEEHLLMHTPDGYQPVGDFYIKEPRPIYDVLLKDGKSAKVSIDHLFETPTGWVKAGDLNIGDKLITVSGNSDIAKITVSEEEIVYDWEILHENHRYWTASGISSHNTGKTFLTLNICREAQHMGYDVIYCDSEAAVDQDVFEKFNIDPERIRYQPVTTVQEFTIFVNNLLHMLEEARKSKQEVPKLFLVLDSLGNLASSKEKDDALSGNTARDMTKQQVIRTLFRTVTVDLAANKVPFVITNHTYSSFGLFARQEISGGGGAAFNPSIILMLSKAQLKEGSKEGEKATAADMNTTGIVVTSRPRKNRFAKPIPVRFHISFFAGMNKYTGLERYINWENCGIEKGEMFTDAQWKKESEDTRKKYPMDKFSWTAMKPVMKKNKDGEEEQVGEEEVRYWFKPKSTVRSLVVRHLNDRVPATQLFTPQVLTKEVLEHLDNTIIKPLFMLPEIGSLDDLANIADEIDNVDEDDKD